MNKKGTEPEKQQKGPGLGYVWPALNLRGPIGRIKAVLGARHPQGANITWVTLRALSLSLPNGNVQRPHSIARAGCLVLAGSHQSPTLLVTPGPLGALFSVTVSKRDALYM